MQQAILRHKTGNGSYKDYELVNQITTLGRSSSNDIVINDTSISRLHIRVENRGGQYFLVDNNSSNGTFLNRRKVSEAPLKDGDDIMAGRVHLHFTQPQEASGAERTQSLATLGSEDPAAAATLSTKIDAEPEVAQTVSEALGQGPSAFVEPEETAMAPPPLPAPPPASVASPTPPADNEPWDAPMPIPVPQAEPAPPPPPPQAPQSQGNRPKPITRLLAYLIDIGVILALQLPSIILSFVMPGMITQLLGILASGVGIVYIAVAWQKYGKTLGKHYMKIKIVETGKPDQVGLPPKAVGLRLVGYILSAIPCGLGFLFLFFNEEGLGIQDKIAGTEVIEA